MKSSMISVSSDGKNMKEALELVERAAARENLSGKEAIRLRLLAEEMMGLVRAITGNVDADFFLEWEGRSFRLSLEMDTELDMDQRDHFLSVSSTGVNAAAVGFMGKIRDMFEYALSNRQVGHSLASMSAGSPSADGLMLNPGDLEGWSLVEYRKELAPDAEQWDELEKSIVARIADDVQVSFRGSAVSLVILKKF